MFDKLRKTQSTRIINYKKEKIQKRRFNKQMSLWVDNIIYCPDAQPKSKLKSSLTTSSSSSSDCNIPTLTLTLNPLQNDEVTINMSNEDSEKLITENISKKIVMEDNLTERGRSSSIESANSLIQEPNNFKRSIGSEMSCNLVPENNHDIGIRRVSEISHINELRREVSGLDHLASEFYEISRQSNPDSISLDSIHKKVLQRCQNKYIPPQKSSIANKCFVLLTGTCTLLGIVYGFWFKNFSYSNVESV
nr:uncharacterized protein LOC121127139 [Lepeophtheirus salmonis]